MLVVVTILWLKIGNVIQSSPYRPTDRGWNGRTRLTPYLSTFRLS
ncbi:hypothetical protein ACFP1C_00885 [Levilactobacillus fujinensis]|uniref:Uncharacterized protein n=1 Tax=Levilactobacillus fujinensis TaxID=2486024 RepID=A0ABW1TC78_9LACO